VINVYGAIMSSHVCTTSLLLKKQTSVVALCARNLLLRASHVTILFSCLYGNCVDGLCQQIAALDQRMLSDCILLVNMACTSYLLFFIHSFHSPPCKTAKSPVL
jgi:hypothetical protein